MSSIGFDSVSNTTSTASNYTSISWSHTVNVVDSTVLIVGLSWRNVGAGTQTVTSVTYNGSAMTLVRKDEYHQSASKSTGIYYLVNPASGAHTVQVTWEGTIYKAVGGAVSFTGVDQTNPVNASAGTAGATGTALSTSITTTVANTMLFDVVNVRNPSSSSSAGGGQTSRWNFMNSSHVNGAASTMSHATASQTAMTWTIGAGSDGFSHSVVALSPAQQATTIEFIRTAGVKGTSFTMDIGTPGTNRLVVVQYGRETKSQTVSSVTVNGKTCALVLSIVNTIGAGNTQEMWYIDESGLGASTGVVTITVVGGTSAGWSAAQLFEGVLGGAPFHVGYDNTSGAISTLTVTGMQCPANGLLVAGFAQGNASPGVVASVTSPLVQRYLNKPNSATLTGYSGVEVTEVTDKTYVLTWTNSNQYRGTAIIATWPPSDYAYAADSSNSSSMII